ncbi:MAG: AbrB/MazE/SpoVT family DNA-binding domain-containing protein [Halobacteriaceae archaeon]
MQVSEGETRKLQAVGGGTVTVSLPKQWATEQGLDAGAEVNLYRHADGAIVVRGPDADAEALTAVHVTVESDAPERVRRALRATHDAGFETATLSHASSFTDEQRRAARRVATHLTGAEVRTTDEETIRLQTLLDPRDVSVQQSVAQLRFLALSVHREGTEAAVEGDADADERLADRAAAAARLHRMVGRHLERSLVSLGETDALGVSRPTLRDYAVAARALDGVARQGVRIARAASSDPLPEDEAARVRARASAARDAVDDATDAVFRDGDVAAAHDALDGASETVAAVDETAAETPRGGRVLECLARTAGTGETIARAALRADVREE